MSIIAQKRCTKCGEEKPDTLEYFPMNKGKLSTRCRTCYNARKRAWRKVNPDSARGSVQRWREANREKAREATRLWDAAHPEKAIERNKRWQQNNREKVKLRLRQYRKDNPEKEHATTRRYRRAHPHVIRAGRHKRRALVADTGEHFTAEDLKLQYKAQKGLCWWCSKPVGDTWHADHIKPIAKGGGNNSRNIVIACPECNHSKGAKMPHEWNGRLF